MNSIKGTVLLLFTLVAVTSLAFWAVYPAAGTVTDREPLRAIVNAWSRICGQPQNNLWPQVRAAFNLVNIKELPAEWVPGAIAWVQGKIDERSKALPLPALSAPRPFAEDGLNYWEEALKAHKSICDVAMRTVDCCDMLLQRCRESFAATRRMLEEYAK